MQLIKAILILKTIVMIKEIWKYTGIAALLFTMSACEDDDNDIIHDIEPGTFEVTISGDVEAEFEGSAIFTEYEHPETGDRFFILGFGTPQDTKMLNMWLVRTGEYPGDGNFDISQFDPEDFDEENWLFLADEFVNISITINQVNQEFEIDEIYFSDSGTITLELTGDNTVTGEFDFSATGFLFEMDEIAENKEVNENESDELLEVNFSGSFNAVSGQVQIPEF